MALPLDGCVLLFSGFNAAEANEMRDKALGLGAQCLKRWTARVTHVVCALASGKQYKRAIETEGVHAVPKEWLTMSEKSLVRMDETDFPVDETGKKRKHFSAASEGETEERAAKHAKVLLHGKEVAVPRSDSDAERQMHSVASDVGGSASRPVLYDLTLPSNTQLLQDCHFFLYKLRSSDDLEQRCARFVEALGGIVDPFLYTDTTHVVTEAEWEPQFGKVQVDQPELAIVRPRWLEACGKQNALANIVRYAVREGED